MVVSNTNYVSKSSTNRVQDLVIPTSLRLISPLQAKYNTFLGRFIAI